MKTNLRHVAFAFASLAIIGCKSGGQAAAPLPDSMFTPLPPVEREVGPDGSEIVAAPPADGEATPRTWSQKIAAFCNPKPPPKSQSNRVYESDNIPYTD